MVLMFVNINIRIEFFPLNRSSSRGSRSSLCIIFNNTMPFKALEDVVAHAIKNNSSAAKQLVSQCHATVRKFFSPIHSGHLSENCSFSIGILIMGVRNNNFATRTNITMPIDISEGACKKTVKLFSLRDVRFPILERIVHKPHVPGKVKSKAMLLDVLSFLMRRSYDVWKRRGFFSHCDRTRKLLMEVRV